MRAFAAVCIFLFSTVVVRGDSFDVRAHYIKSEFRIPMRDGVRLFTSVYAPKDGSLLYPILLTRTPYGIEPYGVEKFPKEIGPSRGFEREGFIFVFQDVRGRYMSEGEWTEMTPEGTGRVDESTDAYDTIEWLVKNIPNNNGKVGMLGISYPGFYTTAALIHSHPALVAASPQAPIADLYKGDDAYHNGAFFLIANFSFYTDFARQKKPVPPGRARPFDYGTKDGYRFYLQLGSLINSEKYFKQQNPYWTNVMEHTSYDAFWRNRNILPHLRDVKPEVLIVGGWFDAEDLSGTLKTFRAIEGQSPETKIRIVMGPWVHGGWDGASGDKLGPISFGSNTSEFFEDKIALPFFRHALKGGADPGLPNAFVFETGRNEWRGLDSWPPRDVKSQRLYLRAHGALRYDAPVETSACDEYVSDPNHPVPSFDKPTLDMDRRYMIADQRFVEERSDILTYATEPLAADVTVAGPISPSLFVSSSGTDSDYVVKVIDAYPEDTSPLGGYEQLVRGEPFRAKFREGFERAVPLKPGEVEHIEFSMPDVYHCFRKGHRIMVQIQSSWFPLVDRNPQTFTDIPKADRSQFRKAKERIYRSSHAASFIEIPVKPQGADSR